MSSDNSQILIDEFRSRFPIFDQIAGRFGVESEIESVPWFYALLLAAAQKLEPGAICFVLDKTLGTTALTAVFLALSRLQADSSLLIEEYAKTAMHKGQLVQVKPSNYVYEYDGVWKDFPDQFRLKVQDKEEWRNFPISDVLRLEPTTRKRPKGTLISKLGVFEQSCIDELLGITTFGNDSIIRNSVMLYMSQARFSGIMEQVFLTPSASDRQYRLSDFLPWGTIGPGGEIRVADSTQVIGEPLIAVTRVPQDLASAAIASSVGSKLVLVDGVRGITNDLQAFDDTADHQSVVILASPDEVEEVGYIRDRNHPVWYLSANEITLGEDRKGKRSRVSLVGKTVRLADLREETQVVHVSCQDEELQAVADNLESIASEINRSEEPSETSEVAELLTRFYGILLEYSESCFNVTEGTRAELQSTWDAFTRNRMWMPPEIVKKSITVLDLLSGIASRGIGMNEKANALLDAITESDERWAIASRSSRVADCLRAELSSQGDNSPVYPIQALNADEEWEGIILLAWPGRRRFTRLRNLVVTKHIRILTYPFEYRWLMGYQNQEDFIWNSYQMENTARAEILGIDSDKLRTLKSEERSRPSNDVSEDHPMLEFEKRFARRRASRPSSTLSGDELRPARLVEFYGGCYAFLTEWSQLYVLNDLITELKVEGGRLRMASATDLSIDDFVLFRASGDKELTRLLAEDEMGIEEYQKTRATAERWKSSLLHLGSYPEVIRERLAQHGLDRTLPTITRWMESPELISPHSYESEIEIIGKASNDDELLDGLSSVLDAISMIRGAHIRAGNQLTKLIVGEVRDRIGQLDEQPVLLDLVFGQAWVVQVETVDLETRECASDQVNRLLWADDPIF